MCLYYYLSGWNNIIVLPPNYLRKHLINMLYDFSLWLLNNLLDCEQRLCNLQIINALQHAGLPNWKLIQIQKHQKVPQTTGLTDVLYCHSGYLNSCTARNYGPHYLIFKKWCGSTDRNIRSTEPHWVPLFMSSRDNIP